MTRKKPAPSKSFGDDKPETPTEAFAPSPSVLDAVIAATGRTPVTEADAVEPSVDEVEPVEVESLDVDLDDDLDDDLEDDVHVPEPITSPATRDVLSEIRARRAASEVALSRPVIDDELPADSGSLEELGRYVTQVMRDAQRAASEFLASIDADAARRAAALSAQAELEARRLREAAVADADKIRADARSEAESLVAERLRVAVELTDRLYDQAERILADAERPDVARRHLARFVAELTRTAEEAAHAPLAPVERDSSDVRRRRSR